MLPASGTGPMESKLLEIKRQVPAVVGGGQLVAAELHGPGRVVDGAVCANGRLDSRHCRRSTGRQHVRVGRSKVVPGRDDDRAAAAEKRTSVAILIALNRRRAKRAHRKHNRRRKHLPRHRGAGRRRRIRNGDGARLRCCGRGWACVNRRAWTWARDRRCVGWLRARNFGCSGLCLGSSGRTTGAQDKACVQADRDRSHVG